MRFRLRTLLIVLALGPPVLGGIVYVVMDAVSAVRATALEAEEFRREQEAQMSAQP